ncbi:MAG: T9SS type A sorting domain-containing protein [bacterium]
MYRTALVCLIAALGIAGAASIEGSYDLPLDGGGGPDLWGYTWLDSDTTCPGAPIFNWVDIKAVGTRLNGLGDDNVLGPLALGFQFPFYWLRQTSIYVGSNGYIAFNDESNEAHPFPQLPNAARPNNVIAALMSDLDFTGRTTGGRGCWYWTNAAADTFILQCESIPFWNVPTSLNTFQIILSRRDSSICFQYREQTGAPSQGWGAGNATVGIEDPTGVTGLSYYYNNTPGNDIHAGLAIRFTPPAATAYTRLDCGIRWALNRGSQGTFLYHPNVGNPALVRARITNFGTETITNDTVLAEVRSIGGTLVWADTTVFASLPRGAETTHTFGQYVTSDTGFYTLKVKSKLAGDALARNDSVMVEIHVVNFTFPTSLYFDRVTSGSYSLSGPHGFAEKFIPPRYPLAVRSIHFYFSSGSSTPITCRVWDDNGPDGSPGTVLATRVITPVAGWDSIDLTADSVNVQSGGFFVGYTSTGPGYPRLAYDNTMPHAFNSWEYTGVWAQSRDNETQDWRIRARVGLGTAAHDLGVTELLAPTGILDSGDLVTPLARVRNFGLFHDTVQVTFSIPGTGYLSTRAKYVERYCEDTVSFAPWSARPGFGLVPRCSTYHPLDIHPDNDTLSGDPFNVRFIDIAAVSVDRPRDTFDYPATLNPRATVANRGNTAENFRLAFSIPGAGYEETVAVYLGVGATDTFAFPPLVCDTGAYVASCSVLLAGDMNPANDRATAAYVCRLLDVGPTAIIAPAGELDSGTTLTPQVRVRNRGNLPADLSIRLTVSDGYDDTRPVTGLAPGDERVVDFGDWTAPRGGRFDVRCSTALAGDMRPENDTATCTVTVISHCIWPPGWSEAAPVPLTPSGKAVKDGGWIAWDAATRQCYVAKAYKTSDFYAFAPIPNTWRELPAWPLGTEAKPPYKGSVGISDGNGVIYAVKGNNRSGFWKYSAAESAWTQLADVPLGLSNKRVKGGTDLVYVASDSVDFIYLLKGYKTEFYRFNVETGQWQTLADAPVGAKPKWDKGSWLVHDEAGHRLLAHKAKYSEMYAFSLDSLTWGPLLPGIPVPNQQTGKNKKAKDGSDATVIDNVVYTLKGGNTVDFYCLDLATGTWAERETIPSVGSTMKKKRVKGGASVTGEGTVLFALKGNKTRETWRYVPAAPEAGRYARHARTGVQGGKRAAPGAKLFVQSPASAAAEIRWSAPVPASTWQLSVYDAVGRCILLRALDRSTTGALSLDVRALPAGVYLVRLSGGNQHLAARLVVSR